MKTILAESVRQRLVAGIQAEGDGCWEWQRARNSRGYGILWVDGATQRTHRLVWEVARGPIPDGMCVLHRCDNPACNRPDHLFLGTQADNVTDMVQKGRAAIGETNGQSKITTDQVVEIRQRYAKGGVTQQELAEEYGVSRSGVSLVVNGRRWSWLETVEARATG